MMFIDLNPKILVWARIEGGYLKPEEVANKLKVNLSELLRWEKDGKHVEFGVLEKIAKLYKRQTAVFFLLNVPQKIQKPKDYRNLEIKSVGFSPKALLAMRRAGRYLNTARNLFPGSYWVNQYSWIESFNGKSTSVKKETKLLRDLLESTVEEQIKQKDPDQAFRYWRNKVEEKLGIFVFQFPMPDDNLDGFSYSFGEFPYAIVINGEKRSVRKLFTLFHELAHILKREPGACNTSFLAEDNKFEIELECNNFAGNILVPGENVEKVYTVEEIFKIARILNVSGEVYLRRLLDESSISRNEFFEFLKQVRKISENFPRKKKQGHPSPIIQSKSTRGNRFFGLITDAALAGRVSFSTASDLLSLKIGSIRL